MAAVAGTPWVSQTGLTRCSCEDRLTRWSVPPGRSWIRSCILGYVENSLTRYSAVWVRSTDTDVRRVLIGQTAALLTSWNAVLQNIGWRLVWLNGFTGADGEDYYNAVWRRTNGSAQTLRLGDTLANHQAEDAQLSSNKYYLDNLSVHRNGLAVRYSAWWNHTPSGLVPQTQISYGLNAEEYQTEFNARAGSWRLVNVCGYRSALAGVDRFTTVWRRPVPAGGLGLHSRYDQVQLLCRAGESRDGWLAAALPAIWTAGSEVRWPNAVWQRGRWHRWRAPRRP